MDDKEKAEALRVIGESLRMSELSDENLVRWVIIDLFQKVAQSGIQMNHVDFSDMVSYALCDLAGFHRIQSCKW